jgi:DNA (cytosine-5)-methyltransferase 1
MKPLAFKVRTQGHCSGINGGKIKDGRSGGCGALWYEDKTFTIAATQDQWLCTSPAKNNYTYNPPKMNPSTKPLRYLSVCSGMEAATVAWHHLGWTPVGFSEIESFPSQILKHHYPHVPNYGDLTQYKQWPIERGAVNLLIGGTPCQSYSIAGKRGGLNDPRGQLMFSFLDLADKLKPEWIIWENVPGVLSSGQPKGSDFGCFLQGLVERGYGFAYRVLNAEHFGTPQRRRRVFVVCRFGDWKSPAKVLSIAEGLSGYLEKSEKKRKGIASDVGASSESNGILWSAGDQANAERLINKAGTLNCNKGQRGGYICPTIVDRAAFNQGQNAQYEPLIEQTETCPTIVSRGPHAVQHSTLQSMAVRRLTPVECERLQGFPDNYSQIPWKGKPASECPDGPRYKACGNSFAVPVVRWIGERIQKQIDGTL